MIPFFLSLSGVGWLVGVFFESADKKRNKKRREKD